MIIVRANNSNNNNNTINLSRLGSVSLNVTIYNVSRYNRVLYSLTVC